MVSSIQGKNTLITITIVALSLAALLLVDYELLKDFSLDNAERTSALILDSADSQLDLIFGEIEALVTSLSSSSAVQDVDIEEMSELFINNVVVRHDRVRALYLGTADGRMFEWGMGPGFTNYTPVFPEGYDPRLRPWYIEAIDAGEYCLTSPYIYASVEALGITAVKPVYKNDQLVGVLGLDLIFNGLDNVVAYLKIPMKGRVILLNKKMEILVDQFSEAPETVTELKTFNYPELVNEETPFTTYEIFGDRFMVSTVRNESTGWIMLLFLPYSEIMDFSQQTIFIIIILDLLLMFLLGALIAFTTRRLVTNPLEKIISVLHRFEGGDTRARIPELPGVEFNLMARLFNQLSDQSAESSQRMEEKVAQRTQAVIKLQQENVRLRLIEEKERIFGNLHDSLGARLTGINISNHVAKSALERDEKLIVKEMLERIEKNTGEAILDLKEILSAGEGRQVARLDLFDFFDKVVSERLKLKNIKFECSLPDDEEIALMEPDFIYDCEKIIQELVSNTMKHSSARRVWIKLSLAPQKILLKYSDDGEGFILRDAVKNGFGLQGLYSRAERMDGVLKIIAKPGKGANFDFQFRVGE
ncbi:MAG: cache domain-containing protein [Spirochaetales bacterium]|nr:cache domain-containing protein [Spirochaetales bacterium]